MDKFFKPCRFIQNVLTSGNMLHKHILSGVSIELSMFSGAFLYAKFQSTILQFLPEYLVKIWRPEVIVINYEKAKQYELVN